MTNEQLLKQLANIYERYNFSEEEPDIVDTVDTVNYLLSLLGMDEAVYQVIRSE